jgi:glutathione peroxidase
MTNYRSLLAGVVAMAMVSGYLNYEGNTMNSYADEKKADTAKALSFQMKDINDEAVDLSKYAGKVVVFVNVASQCGYTNQYEGLQKVYDKYKEKGLVIVGVPCNQFGGQEPGSNKKILEFCQSTYKVSFDMLAKVDVKSDTACDLYKHLSSVSTKPLGAGPVKWNFEKFVLGRDGEVIGRFGSGVKPEDAAFTSLIESALAK